ncbi:transposase [Micromonospora sp. LOL_024]|uniref:transposase n=1 Tax=Micromonospora sp. LOL_024 TaxID=3345412 RepID=UPI003A884DC6
MIRPQAGTGWAPAGHPHRLPTNYHKLHEVRQSHGCYSVGDDQLWGVVRRRKSAANTLTALKSIRATRPDGAPIYVILDNLSAHKGSTIRRWTARNKEGDVADPVQPVFDMPFQAGPFLQVSRLGVGGGQ